MKVKYEPSIKEQKLNSKKTVHITISSVRHRVLKAQVALHNTSIQGFFEEVCGLLCEEDERILDILRSLADKKLKKEKRQLVNEEKDEIYKYIENEN